MKYQDVELKLSWPSEEGRADTGDLDADLSELLGALALAAAEQDSAVVLFVDELQYVREEELASLIVALHEAGQRQRPVTMIAAGLTQTRGKYRTGEILCRAAL